MAVTSGRLALFASLGPALRQYSVDPDRLTLTRLEASTTLPADVQYACADSSGQHLYVVSSNGGPGRAGDLHRVSAFRIDWDAGLLRAHGDHVPLRHRPIHITTDMTSEYALIAYNNPSAVTVHRIGRDGAIGTEVAQPVSLQTGFFPHHMLVFPSNRTAILVARGNDPTSRTPEDPGALKVFEYGRGRLLNVDSVAPGGGYGFGPRNAVLSPSRAWLFVSLERQNTMCVFKVDGETIAEAPSFEVDTLADTHKIRPRQMAGAIDVHPSGRFVYLANRAFGSTAYAGSEVFAGGENTIAVYSIDEETGKPDLVQRIDTYGIYPRTFSIDPSGRMLVVGNSRPLLVRDGAGTSMTWANLSVFSIGADGRLTHERTYDIDSSQQHLFWSGMVSSS